MDNSPLSRLPGELRNKLYELVLFEEDGVTVSPTGPKTWLIHKRRFGKPSGPRPLSVVGLPATCKAIRSECLRIFYAINTFTFETKHFEQQDRTALWFKRLAAWVSHRQRERILKIDNVVIDLGDWTCKGALSPPKLQGIPLLALPAFFKSSVIIKIRAYLGVFYVDPLHISFPLSDPEQALDIVRVEKELAVHIVKQAVSDGPLLQLISLEMLEVSMSVLVNSLNETGREAPPAWFNLVAYR